jgi:hypothetical protein
MEWTDPAAMSDREIEAALSEVASKLSEALKFGRKIAELEGRQWRLRFEQRFRRGDSHEIRTDDRRRTRRSQAGVF